jgi:NhaA family Na+:H+ antiporter
MPTSPARRLLFGRGSWPEARRIGDLLRVETVGGLLLVGAALVAIVWANSPWRAGYVALGATTVGPAALHLDLPLATWAADGLLAIFFFVAGLELKREFVAGDLREPRRAALPVAAAVGGILGPALIYVASRSSRSSTPTSCTCCRCCSSCSPWPRSRSWCSDGCGPGGCCSRSPSRRGR